MLTMLKRWFGSLYEQGTPPRVGSYHWVRFRSGIAKNWQPGQIKQHYEFSWVALPGNVATYPLSSFDVGPELVPPGDRRWKT